MDNKEKIKNIIKKYVNSSKYNHDLELMKQGVDYYNQNNTSIKNRKMEFYDGTCRRVDPYKANHKITGGFMKLLTGQKVNYSINSKLSLATNQEDAIVSILGNYRNSLKKIGIEASKKGVAYMQVYIENDVFKYKIIPSEQIIAIPKEDNKDIIEYVIRVYSENATDKLGRTVKIEKAQFWDSQYVYYYENDTSNFKGWELEKLPHNPEPHIKRVFNYNSTYVEIEEHSWGKPPFCVLYNNDERTTDLHPIKALIDVYDIVLSDFANNLEDFQDVYWILKNYGGEDFDEVMEQIKRFKVVATGEDGDATTETIEIPVEARQVMLSLVEKLIYKFGMGVNIDSLASNVTNVQIYALYSNLDLKANDFEAEVEEFWQQLMYFVNVYFMLNNKGLVGSSLVFNRNIMLSENEKLEANANQIGVVSEHTRLANHPWVQNVNNELFLIQKEQGTVIINDDVQ